MQIGAGYHLAVSPVGGTAQLDPLWLTARWYPAPTCIKFSGKVPGTPYASGGPTLAVALFVTCLVDTFFPETGEATVRLLRQAGLDVEFPMSQTCCGQPAFNTGYWDEARAVARTWLDAFDGHPAIVTPSGSCAAMVRHFYPELFRGDPQDLARARSAAQRLQELSELLDGLGHRPWAGTKQGRVTYHDSCHLLRGLGLHDQPRRLLREAGYELVEMEGAEICCGFGGTFAIKYPGISYHMARRKMDWIAASQADLVVTADAGCRSQLGGALHRQGSPAAVLHLAEALAP